MNFDKSRNELHFLFIAKFSEDQKSIVMLL